MDGVGNGQYGWGIWHGLNRGYGWGVTDMHGDRGGGYGWGVGYGIFFWNEGLGRKGVSLEMGGTIPFTYHEIEMLNLQLIFSSTFHFSWKKDELSSALVQGRI